MVLCVVIGCSKRSERDKDVSFHRLPAVHDREGKEDFELRKKRRDGYLAAISREDIDVNELHKYRICSLHFVSNWPADLYDTTNPNWLPTMNLGHDKSSSCQTNSNVIVERWERAQEREQRRAYIQEVYELLPDVVASETDLIIKEEVKVIVTEQIEIAWQYFKPKSVTEEIAVCSCSSKVEALERELIVSKSNTRVLAEKLPPVAFSEESLVNDEMVRFYTGMPNIKIVKAVFDHVSRTLSSDSSTKLSPFQELMCTLLKLRLNSPIEDLAYRFGVSPSTVSRILSKWLKQMDTQLQPLIIWPDRDVLQKTMPVCFQESFGKKVVVIIDCFEIFVDRPSNLSARASTWSNYKHKNTAKVLLGITPQGVISFVSESWGGRASDKHITQHCGILSKLLPGDVVLADRGFDIAEAVGMMQAQLHIPAFTKGKQQLSALEVENTRTIANVRIHVERVIGFVRQRYTILQGTVPIDFLSSRKGEEIPLIDRMIRVCCALNNLCDSVIPFD